MMKKVIRKKAFSLIELSVVIMIIAVLVSAVVASDHLVRSSRVAAARSVTLSSQIVTIPGMVVWYETTTKESFPSGQNFNGAQITTWYNREPSNFLEKNNLTTAASNAVVYQERSINNLPAVRFTTSGNMTLSSFSGGPISNPSVIIVLKPNEVLGTSYKVPFDEFGSAGVVVGLQSGKMGVWAGALQEINGTYTIATPYIIAAYFNGSSTQVFVNSTTALGTVNPGSNPMNGLTIGTNRIGAEGFNGDIAEVIIFNRSLKETERYDVMSYLSKKYKIPVTGL